VKGNAAVHIDRIDHEHGDVLAAYDKMGAPLYPSKAQQQQLRDVSKPEAPQVEHLHGGALTLTVPAQGLAVLEIGR
jgi:xylan 1,4-beta-xylosidase